jgi:hypothetical protein
MSSIDNIPARIGTQWLEFINIMRDRQFRKKSVKIGIGPAG